jgi:hypothetical protein
LTVTDCAPLVAAEDNVVFLQGSLGNHGTISCSGVLITRTLVATSLGCTMVPNSLATVYGSGEPAESTGRIYRSAEAEANCSADTVVEDGSFSGLYGEPIAADRFVVHLHSEHVLRDPGRAVSEVLRAGATRCSAGLALLQLSFGVGAQARPLRLADEPSSEEPLLLRYLSVQDDFTLERSELPVALGVPASTGSAHTLALSETCPDQSGAALSSATTGALVGLLDSSLAAPECSSTGPGTAVRLAPFRRLLIEAAEPELLEIESGPLATNVVHCSPP